MTVLCFAWKTYWPHAVPDLRMLNSTDDRSKVSCPSCLHALGHQKYDPPPLTAEGALCG